MSGQRKVRQSFIADPRGFAVTWDRKLVEQGFLAPVRSMKLVVRRKGSYSTQKLRKIWRISTNTPVGRP